MSLHAQSVSDSPSHAPAAADPGAAAHWVPDYARVARAIRYLDDRADAQPSLEDVARAAGLSAYHFQRVFSRWAGVSPKRFLQALTLNRAKAALAESRSILDASLDAGLSGPSRLHDLFVRVEAMTPGEYRRGGEGLAIAYGFHPTPFGLSLVGVTGRGLCALEFVAEHGQDVARRRLAARWPRATLSEDAAATAPWAERIAAGAGRSGDPLPVLLKGTPFQLQVWRALLRIPPGRVAAYGDLARAVGRPGAARAVGTALGHNPVAWLIPCHRVIRATGAVGEYGWGAERKRAMLAWEATRAESGAAS